MAKLNDIVTRSISGLVFVAIIVGSLLWIKLGFVITFGIAMSIVLMEFYRLSNQQKGVNFQTIIGVIGGVLLFTIFVFNGYRNSITGYIPFVYLLYIIFVFIYELFRKTENSIHNLAYFVLGQIYIALPFSILNNLNQSVILAMFIGLWANDVGAYLVGSMIGKHKLFERISPKKTWEGFFGGMFFAIIVGFVLSFYMTELSLNQWIVFMLLVSVFGTLGDLVESMLKRTVGVKDSGNIMPGHGGLLDRLDSMLFATPIIFIFLEMIL